MLAEEIKNYDIKQLKELAETLRGQIVERVRENGGHLSSNLGAVEITLALHKVFSFPEDKLIFDVGHQGYAHKLLTGRDLSRLRQEGGESGFPDPEESAYDPFIAGHSGTSVALGIGLCNARDLAGGKEKVICLIGDASLGNGVALESVFSSEKKPENFVVVLNDNGMSIAKNNSALYRAISKATAKKRYRKFNSFLSKTFKETSAFGRYLRKVKYSVKGWLNKNAFFERCGFKYVGPVNGHDLSELCAVLENIRAIERPVLLHVVTQKGKGYAPAEEDPSRYHGVGKNFSESKNSFSDALGKLLCERAAADGRIAAVTAAMTDGVGLSEFAEKFPERFFETGISESYAVAMAAGMAKGGMRPVVCLYSTFLQRAYDQIVHDVCISSLPVLFCVDRAGFVGADGKTHQGLFDVSFLRGIPNLDVYAPKDCAELADLFDFAMERGRPAAIRYPNGYAKNLGCVRRISENCLWEIVSPGDGVVVLASGARAVARALEAKKLVSPLDPMIVNCRTVSPLDEKLLKEIAGRQIVAFEEGYESGGFGGAVAEFYADNALPVRLKIMGAPKKFVAHAGAEEQAQACKLTAGDLALKIRALFAREQ